MTPHTTGQQAFLFYIFISRRFVHNSYINIRVTDVALHVLGFIVAQGYNKTPRSRVHALKVLIRTDAKHPCHFTITSVFPMGTLSGALSRCIGDTGRSRRPDRRPSRAAHSAALCTGCRGSSTCPLERRAASGRARARWARPCGERQSWEAWEAPCGAGARPSQPHGQRAQGERAGEGRPPVESSRCRLGGPPSL